MQAQAQLIQNLKCKHQAALSGGKYEGAPWLLTGLADPLMVTKFAGESSEMATVASYMSAMADIENKSLMSTRRGQVSEGDDAEEEGDEQMSASAKRKARKAAAKAKAKG